MIVGNPIRDAALKAWCPLCKAHAGMPCAVAGGVNRDFHIPRVDAGLRIEFPEIGDNTDDDN